MKKIIHKYESDFDFFNRRGHRKPVRRNFKPLLSKRGYKEAYKIAQEIVQKGFDETEKF